MVHTRLFGKWAKKDRQTLKPERFDIVIINIKHLGAGFCVLDFAGISSFDSHIILWRISTMYSSYLRNSDSGLVVTK